MSLSCECTLRSLRSVVSELQAPCSVANHHTERRTTSFGEALESGLFEVNLALRLIRAEKSALKPAAFAGVGFSARAQLLIVTCFGLLSGFFPMVMSRTPSLNSAEIWSESASWGRAKLRENAP